MKAFATVWAVLALSLAAAPAGPAGAQPSDRAHGRGEARGEGRESRDRARDERPAYGGPQAYPAAPPYGGPSAYGAPPGYGPRAGYVAPPAYAPAPPPAYAPNSLGAGWGQQQNAARRGVRQGRLIPLGQVMTRIRRGTPGRMLDAGLEPGPLGRPAYRVRWAASNGRRIDFIVDAASGAIIGSSGY